MPFGRSVIQEVNAFPSCKQQTQLMSHVSYNVGSVKKSCPQTVKSWMIDLVLEKTGLMRVCCCSMYDC